MQKVIESLAGLDEETRKQILSFIGTLPISKDELKLVRVENIDTPITVAGSSVAINSPALDYVTNMLNRKLIGIMLTLSDDTQLPNSTIELSLDGKEIFCAGTPAKMIFAAQNVESDARFFRLMSRNIKQSHLKGTYTDGNGLAFAAYTVKLTLLCLAETEF